MNKDDVFSVYFQGYKADFISPDRPEFLHDQMKLRGEFYEQDLLSSIFHRHTPGLALIDVGANMGNHSIFYATVLGDAVYAFEPEATNFLRLTRNVKLNNLSNLIECHQSAVGAVAARCVPLIVDQANLGKNIVSIEREGSIPMIPLDSMHFNHSIGFLKIDVEGAEAEVIDGGRELIQSQRPRIYVEAQDSRALENVTIRLEDMGYRLVRRYCYTPTYLFEP